MMHYSATPESFAVLKPEGLLLVDSGGQYYEGTTDITRTIALGEISDELKKHFTAVLRSMLNLADAKFLHGCIGLNLDILARGPIWEMNLDYKCGTGHGVGYLLNVHEAPNGFRWKKVPERDDGCVLEEGMVTTDEPGIYIEGSHGIRTENELVCHKGEKNEYGQFMYFEHITFAPIDLDAVDTSYMSPAEIKRLNDYHKQVYEKLSPYLSQDEQDWLKTYTREV
jgi:Xaa-Pro aminopeptidase